MKFATFQETRPGKRPYNQDRLGFWQCEGALLLAVADGMGGHAHGEVAAQITVDHLAHSFDAGQDLGSLGDLAGINATEDDGGNHDCVGKGGTLSIQRPAR